MHLQVNDSTLYSLLASCTRAQPFHDAKRSFEW